MKKYFEVALGIVTSMGGFLEVGSMATAAQAGAGFGYQLLWPILLGTICLIFLMEMAGRMAAICHHPLPSAVRERFGFNYFVMPLVAQNMPKPAPGQEAEKEMITVTFSRDEENAGVLEGLARLTEQNFGFDKPGWRKWHNAQTRGGSKSKGRAP